MWNERWNGIFARSLTAERSLADTGSREFVEMIPFDVEIAVVDNTGVDNASFTKIVNGWLDDNFRRSVAELATQGDFYRFEKIILTQINNRRRQQQLLQQQYEEIAQTTQHLRALQGGYLVTYEAMSVWNQNLNVPDETTVAAIQLEALLDRQGLLQRLQEADPSTGLGTSVVDVRTDLNRDRNNNNNNNNNQSSGGGNDNLDTVIIVAIVIALLACALLAFALFMAWRTNRQRKQDADEEPHQKSKKKKKAKNRVGSPGTTKDTKSTNRRSSSPIPSEIDPSDDTGIYPNSVISDDINTSLTAYYQSGMAGGHKANRYQGGSGGLNDAASVSSMESYGYSLDGYASSIAPETPR